MRFLSCLIPALSLFSHVSAQSGLSVPCQSFDKFAEYTCQQYEKSHKSSMIGANLCGIGPQCLQGGPTTVVPKEFVQAYERWQQQQQSPSTAVYCKEYYYFLYEMCTYEQRGYFNGYSSPNFCNRGNICSNNGSPQQIAMSTSDEQYFSWWRSSQNVIAFA